MESAAADTAHARALDLKRARQARYMRRVRARARASLRGPGGLWNWVLELSPVLRMSCPVEAELGPVLVPGPGPGLAPNQVLQLAHVTDTQTGPKTADPGSMRVG